MFTIPWSLSSRPKSAHVFFCFFVCLFLDIPEFEVYCRRIPSECSIHHELYHQISSYPDCKTKDLLPSLFLRAESLEDVTAEWSDAVDINNQGTQVSEPCMFLPRPKDRFPFLRFHACLFLNSFPNAELLVLCMRTPVNPFLYVIIQL